MKVRFLKGAAGPDYCYTANQILDIDDELAHSLLKAGTVERVKVKNKLINKTVAPSGSRTMTEREKFK